MIYKIKVTLNFKSEHSNNKLFPNYQHKIIIVVKDMLCFLYQLPPCEHFFHLKSSFTKTLYKIIVQNDNSNT